MTRPRNSTRAAPRLKTTRKGAHQNPTTVHGSIVHAFHDADANRPALCRWYMNPVRYTSEPVNCKKCIEIGERGGE